MKDDSTQTIRPGQKGVAREPRRKDGGVRPANRFLHLSSFIPGKECVENNAEARLYDHVNQLLAGHEKLLSDANRNRLFYQALEKNVTSESSVLDIGSGTGVWAIAAARMGAQRVVAI
jgi:2-polyprenyl-3-methyl-5-hydroxy-6-metoxy-1,4-benzoquinol methylase